MVVVVVAAVVDSEVDVSFETNNFSRCNRSLGLIAIVISLTEN